MSRAARRGNIALEDSDDEPAIPTSRRKGRGTPAAAAVVADSSDDEPVGPAFRTQQKRRASGKAPPEEEDEPEPEPPRRAAAASASANANAPSNGRDKGKGRRADPHDEDSPPPSPKARKLGRDDVNSGPPDSPGPDEGDEAEGGAGWGWVTSKFFSQDEHILEQWADIPLPPRTTRNLDVLGRFKALCMKNTRVWVRGGIAFEKRTPVWELLAQVRVYGGRLENPLNYYKSLVEQSANHVSAKLKKDIRADITRTMQEHAKFKTKASQAELDRILSAYCVRNPAVGYCQSMSHLVGFLMLFYGEESVFWFLCTIIDHYLPPDFYAPSLLGVRVETEVFARLVDDKLGKLAKHLRKHEIDLRVVCLKWFMCFFLLTLPMETAARVWDVVLLEGSYQLLNFGLALLEVHRTELLALDETSSLLEALNKVGARCTDADGLVKKATEKFAVKEKDVLKLRSMVRPTLEKEYVSQLQHMESRRALEEKERVRAEAARLKLERAEELALEGGTSVTKIPRGAFGFLANFSLNSRPKRVTMRLQRIKRPPPPKQVFDGSSHHDDDKKAPVLPDEWLLSWEGSASKSATACSLPLNEVQLVLGATAGVFATNEKARLFYASSDYLCASFLFPPDSASQRSNHSFDVVFDTRAELEAWAHVLKRTNILRIKTTSTTPAPDVSTKKTSSTAAANAATSSSAAAATPAAASGGGGTPHITPHASASLTGGGNNLAPPAASTQGGVLSSPARPNLISAGNSAAGEDDEDADEDDARSRRPREKSRRRRIPSDDEEEPLPPPAERLRRKRREEEDHEFDVRDL